MPAFSSLSLLSLPGSLSGSLKLCVGEGARVERKVLPRNKNHGTGGTHLAPLLHEQPQPPDERCQKEQSPPLVAVAAESELLARRTLGPVVPRSECNRRQKTQMAGQECTFHCFSRALWRLTEMPCTRPNMRRGAALGAGCSPGEGSGWPL